MSASHYILFPHGRTWQIAAVTGGQVALSDMLPPEGETTPREIAERLADELHRLGYTGQGVMLALGSDDCLSASIETAGLSRGDRKAMTYRLEEKLPLAAESMVADFAMGHDAKALGVCVREDAVSPLVHSLESLGVAVQSITPGALLVAQQLAEDGGAQLLLVGEGDEEHVNVIASQDGRPTAWSLLPGQSADVRLHLDVLAMEDAGGDAPIRGCGLDGMPDVAALAAHSVPTAPRHVAAIAGAAALEGRLTPWIELRRGALAISDPLRLHRRGIDALLAAAALFLICLTVGLLWRGHRYRAEAAAAQQRTENEFKETFPGWSLPSNVRTVVESEHRKVAALGTAALPPQVNESAVRTFQAVLSKLPADLRFTMDTLTFNDTSFELSGKVRTFADVDAIATAARQAGLDVPPPQARRDPEGYWTFTLRGNRPGKPGTPREG
jgi:hypothetical protein